MLNLTADFCALFQMYHLVSVRLRHLCEQLGVDNELRSQIWTCFEHTIVHFIDLMQDRHIDQLLMCAVYVMCKVSTVARICDCYHQCCHFSGSCRNFHNSNVYILMRDVQ